MNRIELEQISESEVEVVIPPETPLEAVEQLTKGLKVRGLVEDLQKSTNCVRYFYKPEEKTSRAAELADKLIKSLESMSKEEGTVHSKKTPFSPRPKLNRDIKPPANTTPTAPSTDIPRDQPQWSAGGSGRRYAYIPDLPLKVKKDDDHAEDCQCEDCLNKSNYGPKGAGAYTAVDNARRKSKNLDPVGVGPNVNAKAVSTKPGQMSGKAQVNLTARIQNAANKKQPVRRFTPEEIEAENKKRGLKKHSWGQHLPFPSAEEEIMRLAKVDQTQVGEDALANQLANVMVGKAMLGAPPPGQPTDEQLFGHLVVTEEMAKANEKKWQGAAFDWLKEAAKPISQKFASEEEELAYWNSIKVGDRDDGQSGY